MKKTLVTTSIALGLGLTGVAAHEASASEFDAAKLADLAQNNPAELNANPVQEGSYDISFVKDGFQYDFESDGAYWTWEYKYTGAADTVATVKNVEKVAAPAQTYVAPKAPVQQQTYVAPKAVQQTYVAPKAAVQQTTYTAPKASSYTGSVRLANGNTAGSVGSQAAQIMAQRTGVSASTWEMIIARESNGQVNAYNPSGASGLFQTMPGWGSTATVADQINAATKAYNAQGLAAWGF